MSLQDKSSIIWPKGAPYKAGNLAAWNPQGQSLVEFDVVRATTATRVNEAGLIESVAANVIRRDFTNGGCGDYLIEPQRTNILTNSNSFSGWSILSGAGGTVTRTSNFGTSPDGSSNSTRLQFSDTNTSLFITVSPSSIAVPSIYVKGTSGETITFGSGSGISSGDTFTFNGEWQRIIATAILSTRLTINTYSAATARDFEVYGAQLEEGTYPTSYIPTSGAAVTRNADVVSASNLSALLGDSEGALFVEAAVFETSTSKRISLSDGSTTNRILLGLAANSSLLVSNAAGTQADIGGSPLTSNVFIKVLIRYANNNFAIHQGGIEIGTDTSGTTFTDGLLNTIRFASGTGSSAQFYGRIRQLVVFNQSPTSAQANSITTP